MIINGTDLLLYYSTDEGTTWTALGYATSHSLSYQLTTRDVSHKKSGTGKKIEPGKTSMTGSADGLVIYVADCDYHMLQGFIKARTPLKIAAAQDDSDEPDENNIVTSDIYLTNVDITAPDEENTVYSISFEANDDISHTSSGTTLSFNVAYTSTQFVVKWKAPPTSSITFNWGDDTSEVVSGNGSTLVTTTSNYASTGTYNMTITGDVSDITYIDVSEQSFVSGDISTLSIVDDIEYVNIRDTGLNYTDWSALANPYNDDVVLNGDMTYWDGDSPRMFTVSEGISKSGSDCLITSTGSSNHVSQECLEIGKTYFAEVDVVSILNTFRLYCGATLVSFTTAGHKSIVFTATATTLQMRSGQAGNCTFNNFKCREIVENQFIGRITSIPMSFIYSADQCSMTLNVPSGKTVVVNWGDSSSQTIIGTGADVLATSAYSSADTYAITITGDYNYLTKLDVNGNSGLTLDLFYLKGMSNITDLMVYDTSAEGQLINLASLTSIERLQLEHCEDICGDIAHLDALDSMTYCTLGDTSIQGDVAVFADKTSLTRCGSVGLIPRAFGDISSFSNLVNLIQLEWQQQGIWGDISDLSSLVDIQTLSFYSTDVDGDFNTIQYFPDLVQIKLNASDVGYISATLVNMTNLTHIYLTDCSLSATEVDNIIIDLDADTTVEDVALDITTGNTARTAASDAAAASLASKGWTIT